MKKLLLTLLATVCMATGFADNIVITLTDSGKTSDQSTGLTTNSKLSNWLTVTGDDNVTVIETSSVYQAKQNYGWKFGTGKKAGNITFRLSETVQVQKIIINAAQYSSYENSPFIVNNIETPTLAEEFSDYEIPINASLQEVTIATKSLRAYVRSITLVVGEGGGEPATPTVAAPTITVEGKTVSIAAEEGADIHYTLDGTEPTSESTLYEAPFTLTESCTVKAIAVKDGTTSNVATQEVVVIITVGDGTKENPYTIADVKALDNPGTTAWVKGYIVGCYNNNKFTTEAATATNIALASSPESLEVIPVALPSGNVRGALNIQDNASNLGKEVYVYGKLVAYFSTTGVKDVTDYEIISSTEEPEVEVDYTTTALVGAIPNYDKDGYLNLGGTAASTIEVYTDNHLVIKNFLGVEGCDLRCDYFVDEDLNETAIYSVSIDGTQAAPAINTLDDENMGVGTTTITVGDQTLEFASGLVEGDATSGSVTLLFTNGYYYGIWGDKATSISTTTATRSAAIYNISGQRVNATKSGLYIIAGQKTIIR